MLSFTPYAHRQAPDRPKIKSQPSEPMDSVAAEKRTATLRYRRSRRISQLWRLLRLLEAVAAVTVVLYSSARLPAAARTSGEFLRRAAGVLLGPGFVFVLGNAIVAVLLFKSGGLAGGASGKTDGELVKSQLTSFVPAVEEVVYEDKRVCHVEEKRECRRSQSERMERREKSPPAAAAAAAAPELRRAQTDVGRKVEEANGGSGGEDAEEFRKMVESFIAKQQKFQREESMAIVCAADGGVAVVSSGAGGTPKAENKIV